MGKFPSREIGDEFEAFIGVTLGLHIPHQSLGAEIHDTQKHENTQVESTWVDITVFKLSSMYHI